MTIRRVDPMSAAKIAGSLYAVLGFVVGAAISAFSTLLSAFAGPAFQLGASERSSARSPAPRSTTGLRAWSAASSSKGDR